MRRSSGKSIYLGALLLFLGGLGYLVWAGLSQGSVYFLNVSEALASPAGELKSARLFGTVAADGLTRPADGLGVNFRLADKEDAGSSLWIEYRGAVPDTFEQGAEVIVEGRMIEPSTFKATSLITKCPSKYEKQNRDDKV